VYLKDSWRIDVDGMEKEGDVYRSLKTANVPNVPDLVCAGDVWHNGVKQMTRTPTLAEEGTEWVYDRDRLSITPHTHYRLVLGTIGKPLYKFKSTKQLASVLKDALIAHRWAYEIAKVLHRDLSASKIMITIDGKGLLSDWDMSRRVGSLFSARCPGRTGTWQFMSVALLRQPNCKIQGLSDDLESILWVLLYHVLRYWPTSITP
ncbi:hypothetical protein OF83DRAFT_1031067, partial [Amylostereum chailletii]